MASVSETTGLVKLEENNDKEKKLQTAASVESKDYDVQGQSIEIVECKKIGELMIDENRAAEECKVSEIPALDHSSGEGPQTAENIAENIAVKEKQEENVPIKTGNTEKDENPNQETSHKSISDKPASLDSPPEGAPKPARPDKLPDLPADLTPLFNRCTTMTARVLGLLKEKVTEDLQKNKEANNKERVRDLRSLLWKVCDCQQMGSEEVKKLEGKSSYQLQQMREQKKYGNRSKGKKNSKWKKKRGFDIRDARQFARGFVFGIIDKAVRQFLSEEEEKKVRLEQVKGFIDDIIAHSVSKLILERQHNLSSVEADLLLAMQQDEDEEDEVKTTLLNDSIKIEPRDN